MITEHKTPSWIRGSDHTNTDFTQFDYISDPTWNLFYRTDLKFRPYLERSAAETDRLIYKLLKKQKRT